MVSAAHVGVNLIGYFGKGFGLGESTRLIFEALREVNIPLCLISANDLLGDVKEESFLYPIDNEFKYSINLFSIDAGHVAPIIQKFGWNAFKNRYNIGIFFWETTQATRLNLEGWGYMDEIWTTSRYMEKIFSKITSVPVYHIPQPLESFNLTHESTKKSVNLPDRFTFLFFFSFRSVLERKNPQALIHAFQQAFPDRRDVQLVIKSKDSQNYSKELNQLLKTIEKDSRIIWLDKMMDAHERIDLMNCCDCYVSLHRSEGFGLTLSEAMLLEKPVIATAYSGNMDFMNEENSYLCSYQLVQIGEGIPPYPPSGFWAQPLIHDAAHLMRRVYTHTNEATTKAKKGKEFILNHHSLQRVGEEILKRLRSIPQQQKSKRRPWCYLRDRCDIKKDLMIKKIRKMLRPVKKAYTYLRK
ncbi:MAG: glycosyltransferase [Parachlamydiaceae bacterium]|nr:glycosyltransferase [Parachlamydiaceae bacterium]